MGTRIIYLIRHGKIQAEDEQRRYIGQFDAPLSEEGVRQAQGLQKSLGRADIRTVYCSDLSRSQQTARIIVGDKAIPVIARQDLREIHLGEWEGRTFADIVKCFPHEFRARGADIGYYRIPGGESFADCGKRVMAAFQQIQEALAGNILIVGHAGVNRLLLCHILGMPIANLFRLGQDYGCLNIIQASNAGYQVKLVNYKC